MAKKVEQTSLTNSSRESKALKDQYVQDLARNNYALFRMSGYSGVPAILGFPDAPVDEFATGADFENCNYGVALKADQLVIDVDPRHFKTLPDGTKDNPIERLTLLLGLTVFDTYTVVTGQGGVHIYLKKPVGIAIRKNLEGWDGLDFLSYGAFVMGPGSISPKNKKTYFVSHGHPSNIMDAPIQLLHMLERTQVIPGSGIAVAVEDAPTVNRFISFLDQREGAIQGQRGDEWTFFTACFGRDFGLPEETTYELMLNYFNPKCVPMWREKDLAAKVKSAYRSARNALGNRNPEADFEPYEDNGAEAKNDGATKQITAPGSNPWNFKIRKDGSMELLCDILNISNHFLLPGFDDGNPENPLYALIRRNVFSGLIDFNRPAPWHKKEFGRRYWQDEDTTAFQMWLCRKRQWNPSEVLALNAVKAYANDNPYHPVKDYLNSLVWDGVPRLDRIFIDYGGAQDTKFNRAVGACTFIAMVARIMEPGCKHDYMTVLEGPQGVQKSKFCEIMGGDYHVATHLDPHKTDTEMVIRGRWLVEVAEMICLRKSEAESLKHFISMKEAVVRLPYGREVSTLKRQCGFIGTMNPAKAVGYLKDTTGNRRYWPIAVNYIHEDELKRDRDQLWAEAHYRYRDGEFWYITDPAVLREAEDLQMDRAEHEPWADYIQDWLERERLQGRYHDFLTTTHIAGEALNLSVREVSKAAHARIAHAMSLLGWEPGRGKMEGATRSRGYRRPETLDDIIAGI